MKLITKIIEERFEKIGNQSQSKNPIVVAKFYDCVERKIWYATEYDKEKNTCFGYIEGVGYNKWETFSIDKLEAINLPFGLKIERDIFFENTPFKEIIKQQDLER